MAYRYGEDRRQQMLFPDSIDQYIGEEHPVRAYRVDAKIRKLLAQCEHIDTEEAQHGSMVKMPKEPADAKNLKACIQDALEQFALRSTQTKNGLIVHTDAVSDANDTQQLADQIRGAEDTLDRDCQVACADAGYSDIEQIEKIESEERSVVVPTQQQASAKPPNPFSKCDFTYDRQNDCYWCPQGQRVIFRRFQDKEHKKRDYRIEKPAICRACAHFGQCTKSQQGRTVVRHVLETLSEKIQQRVKEPAFQGI